MRSRYPRIGAALFLFGMIVALMAGPSGSDVLAQRKGFRDGKGKGKQKEVPPPNFTLPDSWTKAFTWRCIGPANMGGRITAISVFEADPCTYWVATASGGLLKTTNNGVTFEHQFDHEATVSIGDVCVAPSNKNIVWVGTGENNPRNSVSYGDGVYKSTDGGKTWKNMGLKKTFQIGKIVIHPTNPDIVYVGALGRLYGPNEDAACSRRPTAARPGRRSGMSTTRPASSTCACTRPIRTYCSLPPGIGTRRLRHLARRRHTRRLRRLRPGREVGSGRGHLQDHRRRQDLQEAHQWTADGRWAASAWTSIARTRTSSSPSSTARRSAWARRPRKPQSAMRSWVCKARTRRTCQARFTRVYPGGPGRNGRAESRRRHHQDGRQGGQDLRRVLAIANAAKPKDKVSLQVKRGGKT